MTLATYQPSPRELAITGQNAAFARLSEWAESAQAAYEVARRIVDTAFVPAQYRGKPAEATAAILAGSEVGLSPMSSLRAFDNIQGVAAPKAITLRAVAQSFGHEMVLVESTETRCVMKGRRKGEAEWQTVRWTLDRAKNLALLGKDNWKKQAGAMLVARATSELARLIASDAILGIGYSSEELSDGGTDEVAPGTPEPTPIGSRRMSRQKAEPAEPPTPSGLDEFTEAGTGNPTGPPRGGITEAARRKLFAVLAQVGIPADDRDRRLRVLSALTYRRVESSTSLSRDEAKACIDTLESIAQREDPAENLAAVMEMAEQSMPPDPA